MDIPAPSERLEIKPKPRPRRKFPARVKAFLLGRIGNTFVVEIPITSFDTTTQTFQLVGATIHNGYLEIEELGGRWRSFYMTKERVENKNYYHFRFASPLTAVTLANLLAAARGIEK